MNHHALQFESLKANLELHGIDVEDVIDSLKAQRIETPSWGYTIAGTRFGSFQMEGMPSTVFEKIEDAAQAHKYTGIAPAVALHIPWDTTDNWTSLSDFAKSLGITIGAINPNLFQNPDYKYGSLASPELSVRQKALEQVSECISIMRSVGSRTLSLWLADGTNFPGQGDFRSRRDNLEKSLRIINEQLRDNESLLIEYKPFEPASYHTDIADWGSAFALCLKTGNRSKVLVDLGHHFSGANIEHIVATLIGEERLGGFHFNSRRYADDDLTSGSTNPYELFLIFVELVKAERDGLTHNVVYMIDEGHTLKDPLEEMIQSLIALQTAYAKALIVDYDSLLGAQSVNDIISSEEIIKDAFATDVRPLLVHVRELMGVDSPVDPVGAFRASKYREDKNRLRKCSISSGLGVH